MFPIENIPVQTLVYAFIGGVLPVFIWLYFLLKEDDRCPEPRTIVAIAFVAGMISVLISLPLALLFREYAYTVFTTCASYLPLCAPIVIGWSVIEESAKYAVAALFVLWRKDVNEPVDFVIYMITVALGFAALENVFFLLTPFGEGNFMGGLANNNLRFIGATLLHVIASSAIGFTLALAFGRSIFVRAVAVAAGLILAVTLHAVFNFFILNGGGLETLLAFFVVWTGLILYFALFEVLRYVRYRNLPKNTC